MEQKNKIGRRSFLTALGLVAAAGVAVKLSQTVRPADEVSAVEPEPKGDGYRLTEHVKKYYRTTTL